MAERAALVTGASSGIGLALAHMLGEEGHALTVSGRRPDKLAAAAEELRGAGFEVLEVAADLGGADGEEQVRGLVAAHRDAYGRLDVLVNNAGLGLGAAVGELSTKRMDLQLNTNLRVIPLFYREAVGLLREAGSAHVINTASVAGKQGEAWLSVYSATKAGVIAFTQAMNRELKETGIKSTALCPAFVDTPMTDFVKGHLPAEQMIQTRDIAEMVRTMLRLSPGCLVPELVFTGPGGNFGPTG